MWKSITLVNTPNHNLYFVPIKDSANPSWVQKLVPIVASVAMPDWAALWVEISGNTTTWNAKLMPAYASAWGNFVWVLAEIIATTDSDYATAWKLKSVWVPVTPYAEAEFAVWAWTFTAADVFKVVNFHSDSLWLAVDTIATGQWAVITWVISSTRWTCNFNVATTLTA